ncbi:hypothetical protein [Flagellimonas allohymeniacidonis]|uniref:Uncharacterized protein n=1 Tax=Flagellimonas allohymeniacidonis TaxID=2517819 RepID=A0A4Q8QGW9_9FLAO|nr:hypothetical protein [Allomuricauda hymeniacidonis]TAI47639.1 hypothetical protein EW142_13325 [Allomuricauda hymeniacidonis]
MSNILGEITDFLHQSTHKTVELYFITQEILSFHEGKLLNRALRANRRLVVEKLTDASFGRVKVVDHLVFTFSFKFPIPKNPAFYRSEMLCLPRPLSHGHLAIDPDAQIFTLNFNIDAPDSALTVGIRHEYKKLIGVRFG